MAESDQPKRRRLVEEKEGNPMVVVTKLIQCRGDRSLEIIKHAVICTDSRGIITAMTSLPNRDGESLSRAKELGGEGAELVIVPQHKWLIPGFVDLHYHAPQLPLAGKKLDVPLEQWLHCAIPLEARCADSSWAATLFDKVVEKTLRHGSTSVVYFGSVHEEACMRLAEACVSRGQRALVGKVCMDNAESCGCGGEGWANLGDRRKPTNNSQEKDQGGNNACDPIDPDSSCEHIESTKRGLINTKRFLCRMKDLSTQCDERVRAVITPRFIPSCSPELLDGLGQLAQEFKVSVQTHAWESDWHVQFGEERRGGRCLQLLQSHGLASSPSPRKQSLVLAHSVHVNDDEIEQLAASLSSSSALSAVVAHCPLSNAYYANGILRTKRMLERGVAIGLGTDVGGVWSSSMLDSMRSAITVSRILRDGTGKFNGGAPVQDAAITHVDAFWMATCGGARALFPDQETNSCLSVGNVFDALVIDLYHPDSNVDVWPDSNRDSNDETGQTRNEDDDLLDEFQKFIMCGDDRNIRQVWVQGRCVLDKK